MVCENIFTVADGAFSHKIDHVTIFQEILNLKGHPNCITGSKVKAILLKGWILPIGGASLRRVCVRSLRSAQQACFFYITYHKGCMLP